MGMKVLSSAVYLLNVPIIFYMKNCSYIPIYIRQDATLHSLFISGNCSTYFGWYFHPSSGAHTTVSTAFGICHTVIAICRYLGGDGTGAHIVVCAPDDGWRSQPKHVEQFPEK